MNRDEALALLKEHHDFPGEFEFRAVVRPHAAAAAVGAMVAAAGDGAHARHVSERRSRNGTYLALHVRIHVPAAERVLDVWEVLRGVDGVLATM